MIVDLNQPNEREAREYDVCIVGSGPAGGTLAAELAGSGLAVCVLESGKQRFTKFADELKATRSEGIHIKDYSRERMLGGSSTTWAGLSSPLDPIDMAPRPFLRKSGWPIARDELLPLYEEAAERYRFPTVDFFEPTGFGALRAKGDVQPAWDTIDEKIFLACDEPQDFGKEQRHIYADGGVDLFLDASVLRFETDAGAVRSAAIKTSNGREVSLRARAFVAATGGIENARLLLNSDVGNESDQVGRYLMNHPKNYHGILHLAKPAEDTPYYFGCLYKGFAGYAGLRLRTDLQLERELMNTYVRLEPLFPWSDSEGVEALVLIAKRSLFVLRAFKRGRKDEVVDLRDYSETGDDSDLSNERKSFFQWIGLVGTILGDLPKVTRYAISRLRRRSKPKITRVRLRNFMEMEPHPDNRVMLADERDAHGQRVPLVQHAPTERDKRTLIDLHEVLVREFESTGVGRLETSIASADPWPIDQDASHHMGTTRMGTDPSDSVVDTDCRVHGTTNLYMAGASVFPTSGCANPTFTIVALSIRLARHLRQELSA